MVILLPITSLLVFLCIAADDLAIPTVELPTGQYCDVQVSHAESPEEFYVQLVRQSLVCCCVV